MEEHIVSAADGSFQIPDVPAGSYHVVANFTNEPIADWSRIRFRSKLPAAKLCSACKFKPTKAASWK